MKIIITGSTGFIGNEVLTQCLQNPLITSLIALSRQDLSSFLTANPKLKVVRLKEEGEWLRYSEDVLREVEGAEGCFWCLGKARLPNNEIARTVCLDYTMAGAKAFHEVMKRSYEGSSTPNDDNDSNDAHKTKKRKFRFVYLSGAAAERDQTKPLWFMQEYRRIRGQVENELRAYARAHPTSFETRIVRPGMVLAKESEGGLRDWVKGLGPSVRVDVLAQAMVKTMIAVEGQGEEKGEEREILENEGIKRLGA